MRKTKSDPNESRINVKNPQSKMRCNKRYERYEDDMI